MTIVVVTLIVFVVTLLALMREWILRRRRLARDAEARGRSIRR
jgi:hypothetical protein